MIRTFSLLIVVAVSLVVPADVRADAEVSLSYPGETCTLAGDALLYDDNWDKEVFVVLDPKIKRTIQKAIDRDVSNLAIAWVWGKYNGQRVKIIKGAGFLSKRQR